MTAQTKTAMLSQVAAQLPTNGSGSITAAVMRAVLDSLVDCYAQGPITVQTITSGDVMATVLDSFVFLNKSVAAATAVTLPDATVRQDLMPLGVIDFAGTAGDITITAAGGQTIMGLSSWIVGSGGVAGSGGVLTLMNVAALNGWVIL